MCGQSEISSFQKVLEGPRRFQNVPEGSWRLKIHSGFQKRFGESSGKVQERFRGKVQERSKKKNLFEFFKIFCPEQLTRTSQCLFLLQGLKDVSWQLSFQNSETISIEFEVYKKECKCLCLLLLLEIRNRSETESWRGLSYITRCASISNTPILQIPFSANPSHPEQSLSMCWMKLSVSWLS